MRNSPLVSVIMPVYNHERYVVEAIESVFAQTHWPIEFVIIDDGSTDRSARTVREHLAATPPPEGVTVQFESRPNKGAHATLNEGLARATGAYMAILNSDDAYHPDRLARCLAAAGEHDARLVFSHVEPVDGDGRPLDVGHPWRHWYGDVILKELDLAPSLSSLLLHYNIGVSTGNFVFHRSLLEEVGPFDDFRYAHDVDFLLRASLIEEPVLLRERLYLYRFHGDNTISENDQKIGEEYEEIVYRYLSKTLSAPPRNVFAPSLDRWTFSLSSTPWLPHLARAVDRLVASEPGQPAPVSRPRTPRPVPTLPPADGRHVTLVSHELSYSGAPVLLRDVALAMRRDGVTSNVISLRTGPLAKEFTDIGCAVMSEGGLSIFMGRSGRFLAHLSHDGRIPSIARRILRLGARIGLVAENRLRRLRLRAYARTVRGPILINSFASWSVAADLLDRCRDVPAYWYIHETYDPRILMRSPKYYQRFQSLVTTGAVTLLFGSDATRAVWADAGFDGIVRYWSGMPRPQAPAVPATADKPRRVILSVQATGTRKGTWTLLEAFALGRRDGWIPADVELRIVGCHPPSWNAFSRDLLRRVSEDDLRGAVRLVGTVEPDKLDVHYRDAEIYAQTSIMECLPLALLGAMACGLPIVATDADGCREAVIDGQTGRLVPPRQVPRLARALADLLEDRDTATALGQRARAAFSERFALEATVSPLLDTLFSKP
ncbi:glycosyltransferase [Roseospira visakhapatnamensis]|uniref:Glycosyltransferase involved in cell wall biosynthesis n=1 Tax=Roseospira visakhapatnamensis TaxID=390880 RepID=A0A7W6REV3_9PROT|nr:glycosyltransferase [Roseospira visakhapatnamensis]MBB4267060.1 glycosyltransferase involved in cell wall biosynthesis [Roseospira visakhapatnamensis]